jgi:eukaryotic-like serine/threonine-protein kinase
VQIPDVTNMPFDDAAKQLTDLGFKVQRKDDYSDDVPDVGKVVSTSPSAGSSAPKGTTLTVTVSKGPKTVAVPDLTGMTAAQAQATLESAGLVLGNVYGPRNKHVFAQTPNSGTKVNRGSSVDVYTI